MLTWRPPSAIFSRTCCRASGGIRLRASSWVTRARVSPSWRAMSARRRDELFDNSACQDLARTSASVSGSFHWPTGGWVVLAGSGKRNSIGDKENGRMPDFWSGIPTKNRRRTGLEKFVCSRASRSHLQPTTYTRWLRVFRLINCASVTCGRSSAKPSAKPSTSSSPSSATLFQPAFKGWDASN